MSNVIDDVVEPVVENEVSSSRERETASKDNGAEDDDMEVIDDLEEGSLAGSAAASGDIDFSEEEEEEDDEPSGSVTPSSSVSSKSESGLHLKEKVKGSVLEIMILLYLQDICPFISSFWFDISQI